MIGLVYLFFEIFLDLKEFLHLPRLSSKQFLALKTEDMLLLKVQDCRNKKFGSPDEIMEFLSYLETFWTKNAIGMTPVLFRVI